jgi:hypothetical protein
VQINYLHVAKSVYRWGKNKEITGRENIKLKLKLDFCSKIGSYIVFCIIALFSANKVINIKLTANIDYQVGQSPKNPT